MPENKPWKIVFPDLDTKADYNDYFKYHPSRLGNLFGDMAAFSFCLNLSLLSLLTPNDYIRREREA